MVKCNVFFAVRTEFLNTIQTNFGFKGLSDECVLNFFSMSIFCRLIKIVEFRFDRHNIHLYRQVNLSIIVYLTTFFQRHRLYSTES
jgi:hypothetical protein